MRVRVLLFGVLLAVCAVLATVTGCSEKTPQEKTPLAKHTGNYSTVARIRHREFEAVAVISQETPSSCSVTFESPKSLKGMNFVFRRDTVDLNYKGLSFQFEPDSVPAGAVAKLAVSSINKAMSDESVSMLEEDGAIYLTGAIENGSFSLKLDGESGNLMKLSIPGEELEIEFSDFRFLD